MSRDHQRLRELLAVFNDLTPAEQAEIQAHVQICPECSSRFTAYRQMDRALAALERPDPASSLRTEFQAKLDSRENRHPIFRFASSWQQAPRLLGQALALILLASLVGVMWLSLRQRPFQPTAFAPAQKPTLTPTATNTPEPQPTATTQPDWTAVPQPTVQLGRSTMQTLAIAADGQTVAIGNTVRYVQLWQLAEGQQSQNWLMPYGTAARLAFSPDGRWLAAGSADYEGFVILWPTSGETPELRLDEPDYSVTALAFSPDSTLLAAATGPADEQVYIWQIPDINLQTTIGNGQVISAIAFSPDGRLLVTGSTVGQIQVWQAADGQELATASPFDEAVTTMVFSPDGQTIAVGTAAGLVQLYALPDMTLLNTLAGETAVQSLAFSANGAYLASATSDGQIRLWEATFGPPTLLFSTQIEALANFQTELRFQEEHLDVIAAYRDGSIRVWQIQAK